MLARLLVGGFGQRLEEVDDVPRRGGRRCNACCGGRLPRQGTDLCLPRFRHGESRRPGLAAPAFLVAPSSGTARVASSAWSVARRAASAAALEVMAQASQKISAA